MTGAFGAIAFGGRLLQFGAPVEKAERTAEQVPECLPGVAPDTDRGDGRGR